MPPDDSTDRDHMIYFLSGIMAFITEAPDSEIAAWQVSFALGTDNCINQTMSRKAQDLGCGTACMSKGAVKVSRMFNLPPSQWMLPQKARDSYRQLRHKQEEIRK